MIKNHKGEVKTTMYVDAITKNRLMKVAPPGSTFKQATLLAMQCFIKQEYDSYLARLRREKEQQRQLDIIDKVEGAS